MPSLRYYQNSLFLYFLILLMLVLCIREAALRLDAGLWHPPLGIESAAAMRHS